MLNTLYSQRTLPALCIEIKENGTHVSRLPPDTIEAFPRMILVEEEAARIYKQVV